MDSINSALTEFDDINIKCCTHNLSSIGVCGDYLCKEKKFYCMKCIRTGETCITLFKHELISISELLFRFFRKQESKTIDLYEINTMMEHLREIDRNEITRSLNEYIHSCQDSISKSIDSFYNKAIEHVKHTNTDCQANLNKLNEQVDVLAQPGSEVNKLLQQEIPKCLINSNKKAIKEFLDSSNVTELEKEKFIYNVKAFLNCESITNVVNNIDDFVYFNKLSSSGIEIENKIDLKLAELEERIFSKLDDLENYIIPKKEGNIAVKKVSNKFSSDPTKLVYKFDIATNAHKSNSIDNVFCAFKTINGDSLVVWGSTTYSIEVYDLKLEKIIKSVSNAHSSTIFTCQHFLDSHNKRDLLITSSYDKSVKVWSVKDNWSNFVHIVGAHTGFYIYSACILADRVDNKLYIVSAAPNEYSKIWDFKGKHIRDFGVNNESTYFVSNYYDAKTKKTFILNANSVDVKSYDFKTGLLYKSYKVNPTIWHMSAIVNEMNGQQVLIESDGNGNIHLWDFHLATVIKTISTSGINLRGIVIWNDQYVFSSGSDYNIKLYDIKNGNFVKNFSSHTSTCCSLSKILHPKYGDCLISHGLDGKLKLWTIK